MCRWLHLSGALACALWTVCAMCVTVQSGHNSFHWQCIGLMCIVHWGLYLNSAGAVHCWLWDVVESRCSALCGAHCKLWRAGGLWRPVHFVGSSASCGVQGVWGELFCQCHLDCRHRHLPLLPPLYHHNLWHRHHHFSEKKITMNAKTTTATMATMNIAEIGCNRHKQRWCTFFEPIYFLAWRTRNLGLFWPVLAILSKL